MDCFMDWPTNVPVGRQATATDLTTAAQKLFSHTAVPDTFWSDKKSTSPPRHQAVFTSGHTKSHN